jgi:hypothetical protein
VQFSSFQFSSNNCSTHRALYNTIHTQNKIASFANQAVEHCSLLFVPLLSIPRCFASIVQANSRFTVNSFVYSTTMALAMQIDSGIDGGGNRTQEYWR